MNYLGVGGTGGSVGNCVLVYKKIKCEKKNHMCNIVVTEEKFINRGVCITYSDLV